MHTGYKVLLDGIRSHWLLGSTALTHPGASGAHMDNRNPRICQKLCSWEAQHPPPMEIALLRRGKGSNHRILRKLNQAFLFQGGRMALWEEPSVTAELLRGSCGNSRPFPGPKNVSFPIIGSFPPAPIIGKPAWRGGAGSSGPGGSGSFPNNLLKLSYMELCRWGEGSREGRQLLLNPSHLGSRGLEFCLPILSSLNPQREQHRKEMMTMDFPSLFP